MTAFKRIFLIGLITLIPATAWAYNGNALYFDGNDQVTIPANPRFQLSNTFTLEAWIRRDANDGEISILNFNDGALVGEALAFNVYQGKLSLFYDGQFHDDPGIAVELNRWVHVAVAVSPGGIRFYVDGVLSHFLTHAGTTTVGLYPLILGDFAYSFEGQLRDVRIWNITRTADEIADNKDKLLKPGRHANLVANYQFNGHGQQVRDANPQGIHGHLGTGSAEAPDDPGRVGFHGFDLGCYEGWRYLAVNPDQVFWATGAPGFLAEPTSGDRIAMVTPVEERDNGHDLMLLRSHAFRLGAGYDLIVDLVGGRGAGFDAGSAPASPAELAPTTGASAGQKNVMGFALRRVSDDTYLLYGEKSVASEGAMEEVRFTAAQLAPYADGDTVYTLDFFDSYEGSWGWISFDSISIPIAESVTPTDPTNLVGNPSFEFPVIDFFDQLDNIPGWVADVGSFELQDAEVTNSSDGDQHLELTSDRPSSIYQEVRTEPLETYLLEVDYAPRPGILVNELQIFWNDQMLANISASGSGDATAQWTTLRFIVTSTTCLSEIRLTDPRLSGTNGVLVDNVRLTPYRGFFSDNFESGDLSAWTVP